jgi:hypothetical protein
MNYRLTLTLAALGAVLAGCATTPKLATVAPTQPEAALSPDNPIGHPIDDIVAMNGPPSLQRDLPDGRRLYQWESTSISATVAPSPRKGEIRAKGATSGTCYYTLYARPDARGVIKVVAVDPISPGCMKLAMAGQAK